MISAWEKIEITQRERIAYKEGCRDCLRRAGILAACIVYVLIFLKIYG